MSLRDRLRRPLTYGRPPGLRQRDNVGRAGALPPPCGHRLGSGWHDDSGGYDEVMVNQVLLEQAKQLSEAERVELADAIWQTVDADSLPVSPEVAALIDQRVAQVKANPMQGRPSEAVVAELRARLS